MNSLIPGFISLQYQRHRYQGSILCYTLSADIKGFSRITEALMMHGIEGAELLTDIINQIFAPCIDIVHSQKGFISHFEGDSFTAIFRVRSPLYSFRAVGRIIDFISRNSRVSTKFGKFRIYIKAGLSYGRVRYRIIPGRDCACYLFLGQALENSACLLVSAGSMQAFADNSYVQKIGEKACRPAGKGLYLVDLTARDTDKYIEHEGGREPDIPYDVIRDFYPREIIKTENKGEFRSIVACMIKFQPQGRYIKALRTVMERASLYGGYFNRAAMGDKGAVILVIFGAPVAKEKIAQRAGDFCLSLKNIQGFSFCAGVTIGRAFTGFIGSEQRAEYTAMGSIVNLSSRMMTGADWGDILICQSMHKKLNNTYNTSFYAEQSFKGFKDKIKVYSLNGHIRITSGADMTLSEFIGREREAGLLRQALEPLYSGKPAGIIYIDGPAGIGKSVFLENFMLNTIKNAEDKPGVSIFYLPCDEIMKKAFNPFIYFLQRFFGQDAEKTMTENINHFKAVFYRIAEQTADKEIKTELLRTESVIASLLGLEYRDSLWNTLDSRGKHENTLSAVKNLLLALSLIKPLILIIEDGHWIDDHSKKLLRRLTGTEVPYPVAVISTCRPGDDGSEFCFFSDPDLQVSINRISIGRFSRMQAGSFAKLKLGSNKIPRETEDLIYEKCEGNPFYLEQILLYLKEKSLLDKNLKIKGTIEEIPQGISQVIIARIDRLSQELKDIVKTASVLGREFAVRVLQGVLNSLHKLKKEKLPEVLNRGSEEQIWHKLNELSYIFHHSLIRDTVYNIQLKKRLRMIHDLAGNVIENLFQDNLPAVYEDLAQHYDRSENRDKARLYLERAGMQTEDKFQNTRAINYYNRLIKYLDNKCDAEKLIDIHCRTANLCFITGNWGNSAKYYSKALRSAEKNNCQESVSFICSCMAELATCRGNAEKSLELSRRGMDIADRISYTDGYALNLQARGNAFLGFSSFDESLKCFKELLAVHQENSDRNGYAKALGSIGNIHAYRCRYEEAMKCFLEVDEIFSKTDQKRGCAINLGNMGNAYKNLGRLGKAVECFEKQYTISREIGDKRLSGFAVGNMGKIFQLNNDNLKALDYFEMSKNIFKELGNLKEYALATGNIAGIYEAMYNYEKAVSLYQTEKNIFDRIGDRLSSAYVLGNLGGAYADSGDFEKGLECSRKAAEECRDLGAWITCCIYLNNMGNTHERAGQLDKALDCYKEAFKIAVSNGDMVGKAIIDTDIGYIYYRKGMPDEALKYYKRSAETLEKSQEDTSYARNLYYTALIKRGRGNEKEEEKLLIKSAGILQNNPDKKLYIRVLQSMADHYKISGNTESELFYREKAEKLTEILRKQISQQSKKI